MTESEWLACDDPDLLLEAIEGRADRLLLIQFVRRCWQRVAAHLPPDHGDVTAADQFAALAPGLSDHDVVLYASDAALKAAQWTPSIEEERRRQAALLRQTIPRPV